MRQVNVAEYVAATAGIDRSCGPGGGGANVERIDAAGAVDRQTCQAAVVQQAVASAPHFGVGDGHGAGGRGVEREALIGLVSGTDRQSGCTI